jgi:uncharacterized protein YcaQ
LAAQGFGAERLTPAADKRALRRLIERLGAIQIDSVNVLARAHTLPPFSRLGAYRREDLQGLAYARKGRALFEYWGHEASLLPVGLQPLLRWRMARARRGEGLYKALAAFAHERQELIAQVRHEVTDRGPLRASELSHQHKGEGGWWGWSDGKRALEWLFWVGELSTATRHETFERAYDLTERVLPQAIVEAPTPAEADAQRQLVKIAAAALGIGSERCLRDYFRLPVADAKLRIAELVEAGELIPISVEPGFAGRLSLSRGAPPAAPCGASLTGPVRSLDLAAAPGRGSVRRAYSPRALYAAREAHARLLRAAVPPRRPHCGARRPQGGSTSLRLAGARGPYRAG